MGGRPSLATTAPALMTTVPRMWPAGLSLRVRRRAVDVSLCRPSPAAGLSLAGGQPGPSGETNSAISLSGLLLAAAEDLPQTLGTRVRDRLQREILRLLSRDLPARCEVRLVSNKSAPRHGVVDQSPAIAIGATVDVH